MPHEPETINRPGGFGVFALFAERRPIQEQLGTIAVGINEYRYVFPGFYCPVPMGKDVDGGFIRFPIAFV